MPFTRRNGIYSECVHWSSQFRGKTLVYETVTLKNQYWRYSMLIISNFQLYNFIRISCATHLQNRFSFEFPTDDLNVEVFFGPSRYIVHIAFTHNSQVLGLKYDVPKLNGNKITKLNKTMPQITKIKKAHTYLKSFLQFLFK